MSDETTKIDAKFVRNISEAVRKPVAFETPLATKLEISNAASTAPPHVPTPQVELTRFEQIILDKLVAANGAIVSKAEIEAALYPGAGVRESNTVEVFVGRLRRKIGEDRILTARGRGYKAVGFAPPIVEQPQETSVASVS